MGIFCVFVLFTCLGMVGTIGRMEIGIKANGEIIRLPEKVKE